MKGEIELRGLKMSGYIDLHIHTTASDGTYTPAEVVSLAKEAGLKAIAITDHDTIAGNEGAINEGTRLGFKVIPGVEISCSHPLGEVHLLGYYIDYSSPRLKEKLSMLRGFREQRNPQIIKKLRAMGINITYEEVKEVSGGGSIGRPHIAQVLKDKGYVFSNQDAFDRYLKKGGSAYVPKELLPVQEAIDIIHRANGLVAVAHPLQNRKVAEYGVETFIKELMDEGIDGMEVYYSSLSNESTHLLRIIADRYGLLITGGTDFHGKTKPGIELGTGMGDMKVPYELLIKMEEAQKNKAQTG